MSIGRLYVVVIVFLLGYLSGCFTLLWTSPYSEKQLSLLSSRSLQSRDAKSNAAVIESHELLETYSYLLTLYYFEQMSNALKNLLKLGPVAMNLDFKIVEPFAVHSRLYGVPGLLPEKEASGNFYSLGTLFDLGSINQSLYSYSKASLVTFDDFILHAPRDIVMVYFMHQETARPRNFRLAHHYLHILGIVERSPITITDCTTDILHEEQLYSGLLQALLNITIQYGVHSFRIAKFLCVAGEKDTLVAKLKEYIGPGRRTVIFPEWRGCGYRSCNIEMNRKYLSHTRPKLMYTMHGEKDSPLNLSLTHSKLVIQSADSYLDYLKMGKTFLAVYVRVEKMIKRNGELYIDVNFQECCISALRKTLDLVKQTYKLTKVLFVTDMGKYGSDSCQDSKCKIESGKVLGRVESAINAKMLDYEPKNTPSKVDNAGFVAMVEMEMLAKATRLITVGSGLFKEKVTQLFGSKPKAPEVYALCKEKDVNVLNEFENSVRNIPFHC
ncbi:uncharacterized protein [Dysidea avara]|uniref:uncharacterized protein n=1 Tax=Dysidea avara TaxID=196820 RepID=UPI003317027C